MHKNMRPRTFSDERNLDLTGLDNLSRHHLNIRKLTGSLKSGADVECLGTGHVLEGLGWSKWAGAHTFLCTRNFNTALDGLKQD